MVAKNNPLKKRNLRVVKWLSSIPVAAVCTLCREFKVPMSAQANLIHLLDSGRGKNLPLQQVFSSGTTLAGIFRLARVPVELLLEVGLGIYCTRIDHQSGYQWRNCSCLA
jgi:hypothetical protein